MATEEKSRDAFEPKKRYAAVGMQQGRVLLDDDFNEAERIRLDEERQVNIDVIGPVGTPDTGFLISNGHLEAGGIDFDIGAGTLYLSGIRLWNPTVAKFSLQDDWLQQTIADRPLPAEGRIDLVYVEAWQQPVTAVEDAELFEVALGGPDSSTRVRTMWRVKVATDVDGDDCPSAWQDLVAQWQADHLGVVDADFERVVDANLQVTFVAGTPGDLCTPSTASGYLGAENQTIRVELVDRDHLTWGFDNGAPAYRATVDVDQRTITLATEPRDQAHWPRAGQIVEILPWSAILPNDEKLAEVRGHLARVETSYNADTQTLVLTAATAVPAGFGEAWQSRADAADLGPGFVFVRVWDRGDDITSDPAIPFTPNTALSLGSTGLAVTITGDARVAGDHWIISARPRTPDRVVPWEFEVGRHVHGIRRFVAPLALVRWHRAGGMDVLHDCRPYFPPLTRIRGCCTYTVGDEVSSFGQFTSIQAAIDALPAEGGKVCVLPGSYEEAIEIIDRANITIEGCGPRSRIVSGLDSPWGILILGGHDITVRDLAFSTGNTFGVVIAGHTPGGPVPQTVAGIVQTGKDIVERVRLENLTMTVGGRAAIYALGGRFLTIVDCNLTVGPLGAVFDPKSDLGRWPAILTFADDVLIEKNHIIVPGENLSLPGSTTTTGVITFTRTPLGGIQIGGGSDRVEIRRNEISGGNGDGITLGSWAWAPIKVILDLDMPWDVVVASWIFQPGIVITINDEGCIEVDWDPPPPPTDGNDGLIPVSMGAVTDIRIVDNDIRRMGRSGIGVARFFDLASVDQLIIVRRLAIETNRITECIRLPIPPLPVAMRDLAAQGVITLADVEALVMRDNVLDKNGKRHLDPVCGVFALVSTGVLIERNRITENAPFLDNGEPIRPGWRGGIVLPHALPPSTMVPVVILGPFDMLRQDGRPSARIADNVVTVVEGRALVLAGQGPMSIVDNHFTSRGIGLADVSQLLAAGNDIAMIAAAIGQGELQTAMDLEGGVVAIVGNTGRSNEQLSQIVNYLNVAGQDMGPQPGLDPRPPVAASGNVLFDDNIVNLDLLRAPTNQVQSVVSLATYDDVGMNDNQVEVDRIFDRVVHAVHVLGYSARVIGNRVKDGMAVANQANAGLSIFSIGIALNMTTNNQTTRCIVAAVSPGGLKVAAPNQVLITLTTPKACDPLITPTTAFEANRLDAVFVED
jgi:hypothetical protein